MREIKFRAWNGHKMFPPTDVLNLNMANFKKTHILMQYTGLKDKNGTEIYEGDIVKDPRRVIDHQNIEVFWSDNLSMFMIRNNRKTWSEELYPHVERYEVIGNIYENPELLK